MVINKRGSAFVNLIILGLSIMIFIFAAPVLYTIISASVSGQGTATAFVMKSFMWIILIVLIAIFFKIISGDEGFFA